VISESRVKTRFGLLRAVARKASSSRRSVKYATRPAWARSVATNAACCAAYNAASGRERNRIASSRLASVIPSRARSAPTRLGSWTSSSPGAVACSAGPLVRTSRPGSMARHAAAASDDDSAT